MTDYEFRKKMEEYKRKENQEAGKAAADFICETPLLREVAGAVVSVLSIFGF